MENEEESKDIINKKPILFLISVVTIIICIILIMVAPDELGFIASIIIFMCIAMIFIDFSSSDKKNSDLPAIWLAETESQFKKLSYNIEGFTFNEFKTQALSFNEQESNLLYMNRNEAFDDVEIIEIPFSKILDVKVSSNYSTITSVSKGGLVGGAAIGGLAFGGFGSVVGAMSANKTSTDIVKDLSLIITLNDLNRPLIKFDSITNIDGYTKDSGGYQVALEKVDNWFSKFTIIMKRNEKLNNII